MKSMNFAEMIAQARVKLGEDSSTNTAYTNTTFIKECMNLSNEEFCSAYFFKAMETETYASTFVGTIASHPTTTSIVLDSAANFGKGQPVWVVSSTHAERTVISSISTATLTVSPALSETYADGDYVVREYWDLPQDYFQMFNVRDMTHEEQATIIHRSPHKFDFQFPAYTNMAKPKDYLIYGKDLYEETGYTAGAGTNTTTVVCSTLDNATDDYYNGWLLVNITRSLQARVTDYVASTKTITLEKAITAQVTTDTFLLRKDMYRLYFDMLMDKARKYILKYYKWPKTLVNDYDIPEMDPTFHPAIVDGAVAELLCSDKQEDRAEYYYNRRNKQLQRAWIIGGSRYGADAIDSLERAPEGYGRTSDAR